MQENTTDQCLLCLTHLEGVTTTTIEIAPLCGLLIKYSHNDSPHYQGDNSNHQNILKHYAEKQGSWAVCEECALVTNDMEKIRQQISKLEDQFRSNAATIRTKLLHCSESQCLDLSNQVELQHIFEIRESLLHLYCDAQPKTSEMEEIQVKIEPEEDENDLSAPEADEFLEDSVLSPSRMGEEMEELFFQHEDSDGDSAFYITPDHLEKSRSKRNARNTKIPHSRSKNDTKQPKKSNPAIIKPESRPRTTKKRLLSRNHSDNEEHASELRCSKVKTVDRTISIQNIDRDGEKVTGDTSQGRKRKKRADKSSWTREKNKKQRMHGEKYTGFQKKVLPSGVTKFVQQEPKPERTLGAACSSILCARSKKRNCDKFTQRIREELFQQFWLNMDWGQKKAYVGSLVDVVEKKRQTATVPDQSRRKDTKIYYLKLYEAKLQVCRLMFLSTLGIGPKQLRNWIDNNSAGIPAQSPKLLKIRTPSENFNSGVSSITSNHAIALLPSLVN